MAKYIALSDYLHNRNEMNFSLSFDEFIKIVGELPKSAYEYHTHWAASGPIGRVALEAGFKLGIHLKSQVITFKKVNEPKVNKPKEIKLREIDRSSWEACCGLEVEEGQRKFVAPNTYSLAQAAYEPDACPMGIWRDGELVGFIMYDFDGELLSWGMCRLMVDKKFQKQGIGEAAVKKLLELVTAKHGHVVFHTSAEPENEIALALYEKLGFVKTGRIVYDEVEMKIQL